MQNGGQKVNTAHYLVFSGLIVAYLISFFFRTSASVVLPQLAKEWSMDAALTSFVSSLYFYAYGAVQPLSGALNDKFGPSKVVAGGLVLGSVGSVLFGMARTPSMLAVGRLLTGLGLAPMLSGALVYQSAHFDHRRYSLYSSITFFMGNLGAVASVAPLGYMLDRWGRSASFTALGAAAFVLAVLLFAGRRYDRTAAAGRGKRIDLKDIGHKIALAWKSIRRHKPLTAILIMWATFLGPMLTLQGLWAIAWCDKVYPGNIGAARLWATLIGLGVMAGNILSAGIKATGSKRLAIVSAGVAAYGAVWVALVIGMHFGAPYWLTAAFAFALGAFVGICPPLLSAVMNGLCEPGESGSVFGIINMATFAMIVFGQSSTGVVIKAVSGASGYTTEAFTSAMMIPAAIAMAGVLAIRYLFDGGAINR